MKYKILEQNENNIQIFCLYDDNTYALLDLVAGLVFLICPYLWLLDYQNIAIFLINSITITYAISIVENYDVIVPETLPKGLSQFFRRTKDELDWRK